MTGNSQLWQRVLLRAVLGAALTVTAVQTLPQCLTCVGHTLGGLEGEMEALNMHDLDRQRQRSMVPGC